MDTGNGRGGGYLPLSQANGRPQEASDDLPRKTSRLEEEDGSEHSDNDLEPEQSFVEDDGATPGARTTSAPHVAGALTEEVVQFTSSVFFAEESTGRAQIDIMRIGQAQNRVAVHWYTKDASAKAGAKYAAKAGYIEFEPGECLKSLEITVMSDDFFDTTSEFAICLEKPEGCFLGRYLHHTQVFILDDDQFPSNAFRQEISDNSEEALAAVSIGLLVAYMRFTFLRVPTIWWKSVITASLDQLWNIYYLVQIYIMVYMVDVILNVHDENANSKLIVKDNRYMTAFACAALYIVPNLVLLFVGRLKVGVLDMGKAIRMHLQVNLFRKYLNYTEESKQKVPVQDLTIAMESDIPMLVDDGYMFAFAFLQGAGKICVVSIFMLRKGLSACIPLIIFPTIMFLFIRSRQERSVELEDAVIEAEEGSTGMLVNTVEGFSLIRDYSQRHAMTNRYEKTLAKSHHAHNIFINFRFWNQQMVPWLTLCFVATYMAIGAQQVLLGHSTVGQFLAMLKIVEELGARFQGLYDLMQSGVQAGSPLVQLTRMMNLETDLDPRLHRNRMRRNFMKERLQEHDADAHGSVTFFDELPICLQNLQVDFVGSLHEINTQVQQSSLVFITGPHSTGKSTVCKLLADVCVADKGHVLFSSHNRCLHVPSTPQVVPYLNLYENLSFGVLEPNPVRVKQILHRLGLGTCWLMEELEKDITSWVGKTAADREALETAELSRTKSQLTQKLPWYARMSCTEKRMIHLARALIFNPEVLVIEKAVDDADTNELDSLLQTLREFVDARGVAMDPALKGRRRPRTAFFSGGMHEESASCINYADVVWRLSNEAGLTAQKGGCGTKSSTFAKHSPFGAKHRSASHTEHDPLTKGGAASSQDGALPVTIRDATKYADPSLNPEPAEAKFRQDVVVKGGQDSCWRRSCF